MQIYLDYAATTPIRREVRSLMMAVMEHHWGNPASIHGWGERAALVVEKARLQVAALLHTDPTTIVFSGGGTESNHLAIFGITRQYSTPQHIIISTIEHAAVTEPAKWLESQGWQVTRLGVDQWGRVAPEDLAAALQANTVLVSIIFGHNEIGTIQPIVELGNICRRAGVCFHTDGVQAVGRVPIDVQSLPIDLLSLSGHKFYGPQGVGALYVRPQVNLYPYIMGGGQERGLRSGTPSVAAIAGLGLAADLIKEEMSVENARLEKLRNQLWYAMKEIPTLRLTGDPVSRLCNHLSFCHRYLGGRSIVRAMHLAGIGISSGSACSSGKILPSSMLLAMGFTHQEALGGIRFTLGKETTSADIDWTVMALRQILLRLEQ